MSATPRWAIAIAVIATGTALWLSAIAGWQRGGSLPERIVWVAIGVVLVVSAHLLPTLIRGAPLATRIVGSLLWGVCMATACTGHVAFFLFAQQHAGEQRAPTVPVTSLPSAGRGLTTVMAERASATALLASANARYCAGNCATLQARRVALAARLDALNAEADEVRRAQRERDRTTAKRDALLADPVTSRLAALLGTTVARVDLLSGLMFAAVLEGVACLLWTVALRSPVQAPLPVATGVMTPTVTTVTAVTRASDANPPAVEEVAGMTAATQVTVTPVAANHADGTVSHKAVTGRDDDTPRARAQLDAPLAPLPATGPIDGDLRVLAQNVAAGLLRPTVADIRRHLGCSQTRAVTLRRQLAKRDATA